MFRQLFQNMGPVTKNLIIINFIIWIATEILGHKVGSSIDYWGGLHYFSSSAFVPTQLLTYMFIHASFMHLFFNMFALFMFGSLLERTLGSARFLFYFISCGIGAALIQEGVYAAMLSKYDNLLDPMIMHQIQTNGATLLRQGMNYVDVTAANYNLLLNNATVGASGCVYGVLLAFGMLWPNLPIYLMFIPIPIKAKWMVVGYAVLELLLGVQNRAGDNVAHFAHLGGMLFGLIMIFYWKKKGLFRNRYY